MEDASDERRRAGDSNPRANASARPAAVPAAAPAESRRMRPAVDDPPLPEKVAPRSRLNVVKAADVPPVQSSQDLPPAWLPPKASTVSGEPKVVPREVSGPAVPAPPASTPAPTRVPRRVQIAAIAGAAFLVLVLGVFAVMGTGAHRPFLAYRSSLFSPAELGVIGLAWREHGVKAWGGIHPSAAVNDHVNKIGASASAVAGLDAGSAVNVRFLVVDNPKIVHAFALVDDTVVITSGMLARLRSDAELMAVLAHGAAHVIHGDAQRALDEQLKRAGDATSGQARAAVESPAADVEMLVSLAAVGGTLPHTAEQERAADDAALAALRAAGLDETALRRVAVVRLGGRIAWLDQHPMNAERKAALETAQGDGREDVDSYTTHIRATLSGPAAPTRATTTTTTTAARGLTVEEVEALNKAPPPDPRGTWVSPDIKPPPEPVKKGPKKGPRKGQR